MKLVDASGVLMHTSGSKPAQRHLLLAMTLLAIDRRPATLFDYDDTVIRQQLSDGTVDAGACDPEELRYLRGGRPLELPEGKDHVVLSRRLTLHSTDNGPAQSFRHRDSCWVNRRGLCQESQFHTLRTAGCQHHAVHGSKYGAATPDRVAGRPVRLPLVMHDEHRCSYGPAEGMKARHVRRDRGVVSFVPDASAVGGNQRINDDQ